MRHYDSIMKLLFIVKVIGVIGIVYGVITTIAK